MQVNFQPTALFKMFKVKLWQSIILVKENTLYLELNMLEK